MGQIISKSTGTVPVVGNVEIKKCAGVNMLQLNEPQKYYI